MADSTRGARDAHVEAPAARLHQHLEAGSDHLGIGHAGLRAVEAGVRKVSRHAADHPCGGGGYPESERYGLAGDDIRRVVGRVGEHACRYGYERQGAKDDRR